MCATETGRRRAEQGDAITVLFIGAAVLMVVAISAALRWAETFTLEGVAARVPVHAAPGQAVVDGADVTITGSVDSMLVVVPVVDTMSAVCLAASILIAALAQTISATAVMYIAWSFLRGRFVTSAVVRALTLLGWTVFTGALAVLFVDRLALNGILAALGADGAEPIHPLEFWSSAPLFFIATAVGLLAIAFRRGIRLQRDTEGLV
ncbi:hypothetical protein M1D46_05375 [Microbacterium sp. JZ70]